MRKRALAISLASLLVSSTSAADAPALISHQGLLFDASGQPRNGLADVELYLWKHPTSRTSADFIYSEVHAAAPVVDGVYQVDLGAGTGPIGAFDAQTFTQPSVWLELILDGEILTPRQRITSVPYSLHAQQCVDTSRFEGQTLSQVISEARSGLTFADISGVVGDSQLVGVVKLSDLPAVLLGLDGAGSGVDADRLDGIDSGGFTQLGQSIEGSEISEGSIGPDQLANGSVTLGKIASNAIYDASISPFAYVSGTKINPDFGGQDLRTLGWIGNDTAGESLELLAGAQARFALIPGTLVNAPNVLAGSQNNFVRAGAEGVVLFGGGLGGPQLNRAFDHFGTIAGGSANVTGINDTDFDDHAYGTVGGGRDNRATGLHATVSGGILNQATGLSSTVGGGFGNVADGQSAIVPGGASNQASGSYSFAAGYLAQALHDRTFIWSDGFSLFQSTGPNQFLIHAEGGVGIGTNAPRGVLQLGSGSDSSALRFGSTSARHHLISNRDLVLNGFDIDSASGGTPILMVRKNSTKFDENSIVELLSVDDAGNLAITGSSAFKPGGGSWSVASDGRLKQNVRPLSGALESLLELRGVRFEYKDPEAIHELSGERIGFVAQQVEPVFPDWVSVGADGYERLSVRGFEALTVEALRDLRREKDTEIAELRRENDGLRQRLERLERAMAVVAER